MKRNKTTYPKVKQIKPFFWKECRFCEREFRREVGYEIEDYTAVNAHLYWSYCCDECAQNIDEVIKLVNNQKLPLPPPKLQIREE